MKSFEIVGLGYAAVDYLGIVPEYPVLDSKTEMLEFSKQGGGPVATAMVAAARLGARTRYIGKTGDDDFGRFILSELEKEGVDTSAAIIQRGAQSPFSFIVVDRNTGKRTIIWSRSDITHLTLNDIKREDIVFSKVLHLDSHEIETSVMASRWANEAGVTVLLDAGTVRPGIDRLLPNIDVLIVSEKFAKDFTGHSDPLSSARALLTGRTQTSIVTVGDRGCAGVTHTTEFEIPAFQVDTVDTTGAGDVFHGAFSYGLLQNWDVRKTTLFASAVAAMKCTKLGGRAGIPSLDQVLEFLRARGISL